MDVGGESHGILKCERINSRQCKVISGSPDPAKVSVAHILNAHGGIDCGDASAVNCVFRLHLLPIPCSLQCLAEYYFLCVAIRSVIIIRGMYTQQV